MKKIEFQSIGNMETLTDTAGSNRKVRILLHNEFKNGLLKLELFSHCLLFTKERGEIRCYVCKILEVNEKSGELIVEAIQEIPDLQGDLVDIKPYFPCEEVAEVRNQEDGRKQKEGGLKQQEDDLLKEKVQSVLFRGNVVGEYLFANHSGMLQFHETDERSGREIELLIKQLQEGDILRVLWWFHRFDDKRYRSHVTCKPPYDNAPRTGVFASRSPVRPNPLASTIVKVTAVDPENRRISILGFDGFEHSVILQVMPHHEERIEDVKVPRWVEHWTGYKVFSDASGQGILQEEKTDQKPRKEESLGEASRQEESSDEESQQEVVYYKELEGEEGFPQDYSDTNEIIVEHASLHNLKDISVRLPKGKITVITGVSGSGKSSLAFDTIYRESQKQFMDLVASNALIGADLEDSKVQRIIGLQPSIAIEQKNLGTNPRSTVASLSRAGEYLRLLFATIGKRFCPNCGEAVPKNNVCEQCGAIYFPLTPATFSYNDPESMCPVCKGLGEELQIDLNRIVPYPEKSILDGASPLWGNLRKHREKPNANWMKGEVLALAAELGEDLEVPFKDLSENFKQQIFYGSSKRKVTFHYQNPNGRAGTITRSVEGVVNIIQRLLIENSNSKSIEQLEQFLINKQCSRCHGERLMEEGRMVRICGIRYPEAARMSVVELKQWCHRIYGELEQGQREKSRAILTKLIARLKKLEQVGLGYLTMDRSIPSLSGGEAQRLKIATQFGSGLSNILYVMDEPSKGLHPKDFRFLIETIQELKKQNNTIILVEHKKEFIQMADFLVEIGPGAGHYGGRLLRAEVVEHQDPIELNGFEYRVRESAEEQFEKVVLRGIRTNNLKNVTVTFPLSSFICVIGVSGSGKSSLISQTLYPAIQKKLGKRPEKLGEYDSITGAERIKDICYVSQNAIGKNSRSNPGTYTGVFDLIREFYANLEEAKQKKLTKEHFSFNSSKGQCEECKGTGEIAIPMHFMPDLYTPCQKCGGKRYQESVLEVRYKGYSIAELLELEIGEVKELFQSEAKIYEILDMLDKVGLSYIKLGQSAATLSGGEAQRIKLAKELCGSKTKDVIYILDEPTTGLHEEDVKKLSSILHELTSKGATVIVIEHNPLLISRADYIIEVGPEGGEKGGIILKEGFIVK
jgi:excinuclease ABC A subunit